MCTILSTALLLFTVTESGGSQGIFLLSVARIQLGINAIAMLKWTITKKQTTREVGLIVLAWTCTVLCADLKNVSEMGPRVWPMGILILDVVLLCALPRYVLTLVLSLLGLYLSVETFESVFRLGLYDIPDATKMKYIKTCIDATDVQLKASPCKLPAASSFSVLVMKLGVLLVDVYCTRGFAMGMRQEKKALNDSVSLAEAVVAALVRFDLDEAKERIDNAENTPLTEVLGCLLYNLHQYRPYLPDTLFELSEQSQPQVSSHIPQGNIAVVFTDLKSSTAIWESSPDAMKRALKIHNKIIRSCIADFFGYEVKTIGDSFMVAFDTLADGCCFAMAVQEGFASAIWPSDLELPTLFESNGWNGLMVRIGVCFGEVEMEVNPVNGRTDYFGRTVNKAARLEGACIPGGVAIDSSQVGDVTIRDTWKYRAISQHLKGIDDKPVSITVLFHDEIDAISVTTKSLDRLLDTHSLPRQSRVFQLVNKSCATVSVVQMPISSSSEGLNESLINTALNKTISCLERTEGSIISVLSSCITIGWNTTRASTSHFQNALRFISLMHGHYQSQLDTDVHIGVSSSAVSSGTVGTTEQRFVTVFGDCLRMSMLLCQAGCDIGAFALCANIPIEFPLMRPIDCWMQAGGTTVTIFEVRVEELKKWLTTKTTLLEDDISVIQENTDWGWSVDYKEAFERRDWQLVDDNQCCMDSILVSVVELLKKGRSLRPTLSRRPLTGIDYLGPSEKLLSAGVKTRSSS